VLEKQAQQLVGIEKPAVIKASIIESNAAVLI